MNWLVWKQHRKQFMIAGIFLVLFAAFMIPTGLSFWHTYQHALSTCGSTDTCDQLSNELFQSNIDGFLLHFVPVAIMFVPILLGLFWGVPLLTREYTEGTNLLVWTRSISRRKWLTAKVVWVLVGATVTAGAFAALNTWWSRTGNALNRDQFNFTSQGIVPIGYAVFAVALGVMFGAWFKRTMAALGVTLFLLIAIVLVVVPNFVRPHYITPKSATVWTNQIGGPTPDSSQIPNDAWITASAVVNKQGQTLNWSNPPTQCIVPASQLPQQQTQQTFKGASGRTVHTSGLGTAQSGSISSMNGGPNVNGSCLEKAGYHYVISYQPHYRYWDLQRIELGLYLALSIVPIAATYWLVLKRDA